MVAGDVERGLISRDWFRPGRPIVVGYAPARLDVMGGIADYSGATVLELPLALGVHVAAQLGDDDLLAVRTDGPAVPRLARPAVSLPAAVLQEGPPGEAPARLRAALEDASAAWASYILGPLAILRSTGLLPQVAGLRLAAWSDVPAGAGISSSAALEVAALRAVQGLLNPAEGGSKSLLLVVEPLRLAALAQQAEHLVARAPCGIMDQVTAVLGRKDHLLMLRCQPAEVLGHRLLPRDAQVFGIDSGVAHRVAGDQYGRVRVATFMGRAIVAAHNRADPPGSYLCNLAPERFAAAYERLLPEEMSGADFLARYGETGDDATTVDAAAIYRVRACTTHPILEQANVVAFLAALDRYEATGDRVALEEAGAAMYRSHHSYGVRCGLGTPETDLIVDLVREHGRHHGLYGAKITGGGAGGTVAVLGAGSGARAGVEEIASAYARRSGNKTRVIAGSADGAVAQPVRRATIDENGVVHVA
jgi:galactokinase